MVIRFLDLGFKFCLFGSFLSIAGSSEGYREERSWPFLHRFQVLVPMYAFSENTENLGKFTRFSLTNIDKEKLPWKFHVVVVCAYLLNVRLSETLKASDSIRFHQIPSNSLLF